MHSSRVPADYRIQKMRAAEESSRQMNAYVKVRTHAISRAVENPTRHANATPPPPIEPSPFHQACNVRDLNAQWENNTDRMIAKNQFKKRCVP